MSDLSQTTKVETWVEYVPRKDEEAALELINMSFEEHMARVVAPAPANHLMRYKMDAMMDIHGEWFKKTEEEYAKSEMMDIRQYALKYPHDDIGRVLPVMRFHHSRIICVTAILFTFAAGREVEEAFAAGVCGWRHDKKHLPYCHTSEDLITRPPFNIASHEWRGLIDMVNDFELHSYCHENNVPPGYILEAMNETGRFPMQSPADTAGYNEHDWYFLGDPPGPAYLWRISESILGAEAGCLIVDDKGPLFEVGQRRARGHKEFYSNLKGRVNDGVTRRALWYALTNKIFSAKDLLNASDAFVDAHLLDMLNGKHDIPEWIHSCLKIARGDMKELDKWQKESFDTKEEYEKRLNKLRGWRQDIVPVPTRIFDSKSFRIVSSSGVESEIKATIDYDKVDRTWFIFVYEK